ncbi:MAG: hypothetical protein IK139_00210, partial [Lachnospiraceae bacterium]|nr:hypothetical protein [Lachnospiraceae bacterium]
MKSKKQFTKRMIIALLSFSLAFGAADPGLLLYAAEETGLSENEVSCNETVPDNAGASENEAPLSEDGVSANEEIPVEAEAQDPFASGELLGWGVPVEEDGSGEPSTINTERRSSDQETVKQLILAKKSEYPEGMKWTNENYYAWKGGIWSGGYGCAGFAFLLSDVAFDDAKARQIFTVKFSSVRVGDILRVNNDTHSVIITEVRSDGVVLAEGNYNSSIHWGREMSAAEVEKADYIVTRYADDPGSGDPNKLCVKIAPSGQYHNWDGVTNVAQFKGADGNLCLAADSGTVVKIYKADAEGKTTFLVNLKKQHNKFGTALCDDSGNYYLVTGEDNDTEDTGVKTVFISKYDSKGNHIKTVGDNGGGHGDDGHCTKIPFYAGN